MNDDTLDQVLNQLANQHTHGHILSAAGPDKDKSWVEKIAERPTEEGDWLRELLRSLPEEQRQQQERDEKDRDRGR
jgi:hypothetical protein